MIVAERPDKTLLLMGRIGAAHGIRGEVRVHSFTQEPLALTRYGPLRTNRPGLVVEIETARGTGGDMLVARLKGVGGRNEAEALNGVELYVERALLPAPEDEDDFYHADLIGLRAQLADGTLVGLVAAVPNYGAGDILEVRAPHGGDTFLYPFTRAVVPEVHLKDGYLVIVPPIEAEPGEEEPD
jgi:16S rRNA processing protein RimM